MHAMFSLEGKETGMSFFIISPNEPNQIINKERHFFLSTRSSPTNKKKKQDKTPYLDVKQLKVKPNRVRVLDFDIRHHIDPKRRIALVERKHRVTDSAHVIDHRDLKDRKDHNHQDNNNQQEDQTDTAGYSAAGGPDAAKTREIFRSFSGGFDGGY